MSDADKILYVALFQFALDTAKLQNKYVQSFIGELGNMRSRDDLRRRIEKMPDGDEKDSIRKEMERLEFEFDLRLAFEDLKLSLKNSEQGLETMAKILEDFKNGQSGDIPPAS